MSNRPLSVEEAYNLGASAMQSQIAAFLMVKGGPQGMVLAPQVLGLALPRFQLPEGVTITKGEVQ
jgi:hypothetical protein